MKMNRLNIETWFHCTHVQIWNAITPSAIPSSLTNQEQQTPQDTMDWQNAKFYLPMSYTIQFYHGGTNQNYSSRCAEHVRNKTWNKQSQKEATSAPILPRKGASQVPGQPWN